MHATCLLDLPDELLVRCLAGAGGLGIGAASATCTRLQQVAHRLKHLPVFSSALSTQASLHLAIKDAAQRALIGCYGAVDFALLFVAKYGSARGKKYSDPTDLGHAVEMLQDVLGQDVVIVGCACSGLMGIGPDSTPLEVDPLANGTVGQRESEARSKCGLPPVPTKGVSVLLSKLPPGCVARAFAQEMPVVLEGDQYQDIKPEALTFAHWPAYQEALSLTSSQKQHLYRQLQAKGPAAAVPAAPAAPSPAAMLAVPPASSALGGPTRQQAAASPETAAAAEHLLSVSAAVAEGGSVDAQRQHQQSVGPCEGEVWLEPQLCLLLFNTDMYLKSDGARGNLERVMQYMASEGIQVVGGNSSGVGDLFFAPGAHASRVSGEPPGDPAVVGLMLCSATTTAAAAGSSGCGTAAGVPAARTAEQGTAGGAACGDHSSALSTAVCSVMGTGPSPSAPLYYDINTRVLGQTVYPSYAQVDLKVRSCCVVMPPAAAAAGAGPQGTSQGQQQGQAQPADSTAAAAAAAAGGSLAQDSVGSLSAQGAPRRSARLAEATAAATMTAVDTHGETPRQESALQKLHRELSFGLSSFMDGIVRVAVWRCPRGSTSTAYDGQGTTAMLIDCTLDRGEELSLSLAMVPSAADSLRDILSDASSSICLQMVDIYSHPSAAAVEASLTRLLPMVGHTATAATPPAATQTDQRDTTAAAGLLVSDCYLALARGAAASGARSGLQAVAVCSCTSRGQAVYTIDGSEGFDYEGCSSRAPAFGEVTEAALVDAVGGGAVPFVGVYVSGELGPRVANTYSGWYGGISQPAELSFYTSMFAAWGCQPGMV